jgi:apolipoprotein N-acyltransferase
MLTKGEFEMRIIKFLFAAKMPMPHLRFHITNVLLSLLSSLLFCISWQPYSIPLLFAAFVPLLIVFDRLQGQHKNSFWALLYACLSFFLWNIITTYWLWNATLEGAFAAFIINTLLMCVPMLLYYSSLKKQQSFAIWIWVFAWLGFEYLHHTWEFSWPWLTLGNAFATHTAIIQWYEYTGTMGGSLWVLLTNVWIFRLWKQRLVFSRQILLQKSISVLFWLGIAPVFVSWYVSYQYTPIGGIPMELVVVQPNIDPYNDKFSGNDLQHTHDMMQLAMAKMDDKVKLVCLPETALQGGLDEEQLIYEPQIIAIDSMIAKYPNCAVLAGADSYKVFDEAEKTFTARLSRNGIWYDSYNAAFLLQLQDSVQIYHKAKLVPGVESMPYQQVLQFMGDAAIKLGGTSGSLGRNKEAENFLLNTEQQIAPIICYESVFGEYVTDYVQNGAGLLCIITNDGWWGNTAGHRQHFDYARLRAIETRRYIARSANTGISGFIDDKGNIISQTDWWVPAAQKASLQYLTEKTFYVQFAHYIELMPVLMLAALLLRCFRNKKQL